MRGGPVQQAPSGDMAEPLVSRRSDPIEVT